MVCLWFHEAQSFPRATLSENCSLLGTDNNVRGQISEHIFEPNEGYCLCCSHRCSTTHSLETLIHRFDFIFSCVAMITAARPSHIAQDRAYYWVEKLVENNITWAAMCRSCDFHEDNKPLRSKIFRLTNSFVLTFNDG